jgi:hypothetical protein
MTGNFALTLPIMLAAAIAAALSNHLTYGNIYTTKLLRRGIDINTHEHPSHESQTLHTRTRPILNDQGGVSALHDGSVSNPQDRTWDQSLRQTPPGSHSVQQSP